MSYGRQKMAVMVNWKKKEGKNEDGLEELEPILAMGKNLQNLISIADSSTRLFCSGSMSLWNKKQSEDKNQCITLFNSATSSKQAFKNAYTGY